MYKRQIRARAHGPRVPILTPRSYSQVLEMLLGPNSRYVFVPGNSPLAPRAQFSLDDEDLPFYDPDAVRVVKRETSWRSGATSGLAAVLCSRSQSGGNATFTRLSRPDNGARSRPADTPGEMETTGRLLFVAVVTCYLLGRILGGAAAPAEVVIYGLTVAFGLEYLVASWGGLWQRG